MGILNILSKVNVEQLKERKDIERLWKEIKKNNPKTRTPAKMALVEIGASVVPFLLQVIKEKNEEFGDGTSYHSKAIRILQLILSNRELDPLILDTLIQALRDNDKQISTIVVELLGCATRNKAAIDALIQKYEKTPLIELKTLILYALGRMGDKSTLEFIQSAYRAIHSWHWWNEDLGQRENGYWDIGGGNLYLMQCLEKAAKDISERERISFELVKPEPLR